MRSLRAEQRRRMSAAITLLSVVSLQDPPPAGGQPSRRGRRELRVAHAKRCETCESCWETSVSSPAWSWKKVDPAPDGGASGSVWAAAPPWRPRVDSRRGGAHPTSSMRPK